MKIGTKSVLFGAHQFLIHPLFLALAWWKLYGFPWDPRLWVAVFVHDLGYIGKPNMDGDEGERHPYLGARIIAFLFDRRWPQTTRFRDGHWTPSTGPWGDFVLFHSRFLAKRDGVRPSKLCAADKLAVALDPWWLYLPRAILSGEIKEYMARCDAKYAHMNLDTSSRRAWARSMSAYSTEWAYEHADGRADTWTPATGEWGA